MEEVLYELEVYTGSQPLVYNESAFTAETVTDEDGNTYVSITELEFNETVDLLSDLLTENPEADVVMRRHYPPVTQYVIDISNADANDIEKVTSALETLMATIEGAATAERFKHGYTVTWERGE